MKLLADARARRTSEAVVAPRLRPYLLPRSRSAGNAARWVAHALQILALALLVSALARPQWGFTESETRGEGRDILIAIDTSRSMLADDLQPSRLARAKLTARDLIASLPSDRFGLMAFAGRAFLQAPLTIDHEAVSETIGQIDSETIPRGGSNLSEPLELAIKTFEKSESKDHALVIFSDGDEREGIAKDIAPKARKAGIMVIAVGVGSETGAIIPDPENEGQFITNNKGEVVRTRLQSGSLSALAKATGGAYLELDAGNSTHRRISDALRTLSTSLHTAKSNRRPIERFQWPLGGATLCLMLSLAIPAILAAPGTSRKRSTTGAILSALLLCLIPSEADASSLLRSAGQAFVNGEFSEAFEKLTRAREDSIGDESRSAAIAYSAGVAAYKMEDYQLATDNFGEALSGPDESIYPEAFYNLGNTLYRRGEAIKALTEDPEQEEKMNLSQQIELLNGARMMWQEAIEQFDETLKLEPKHADALYNKEFIQKLLKELDQELEQKKQQQQQQQSQKGEKGQEGQQGEEGSEGQQGDQGNQGENGKDGKGGNDGDKPGGKGGEEGENGEGGKKENSKPAEESGEGENERGDMGGKLEARNQNPGQGDGQNGDQSGENGNKNFQGGSNNADSKVDPDTGFSKDQARALIRAYTDEDTQARPPERIKTDGNYDNW